MMHLRCERLRFVSFPPVGGALAVACALLLGSVACQSEPDRSVRADDAGQRSVAAEDSDPSGREVVSSTPGAVGSAASPETGAAPDRAASSPTGAPSVDGDAAARTGSTEDGRAEGPATAAAPPSEGSAGAASGANGAAADRAVRTFATSAFLDFSAVPAAVMGESVGQSRFAGAAGYQAPDDPEADALLRGRRDASRVKGDFEGGVRGFDRLVGETMVALDTMDSRALTYLRVSGYDYEKYFWPEFPESRPVTGIPANESWYFLERRCASGIASGLEKWGGQGLVAKRVEFREGRADYANFTMWKGMVIIGEVPGSGVEVEIDFAEVVVERNGLWKVYAYKD